MSKRNELRETYMRGWLTGWEWWELDDSGLCGAAIVQASDAGVLFERITYFDRAMRQV